MTRRRVIKYDPGKKLCFFPVVREGPLIRVERPRPLDSNKRARAGGAKPLPGSYFQKYTKNQTQIILKIFF